MTAIDNPHSVEELKERALVLLQSYQFPEAVVALGEILKIDLNDYWSWNNLGATLEKLGCLDDAIHAFNEAISIDPDAMAANYNIGCAYLKNNSSDLAIEPLEKALRKEPANTDVLENLGRAMVATGRRDTAIPLLERAVAIRPDNAETLYELANACRQSGQNALAVKYFERVVSRCHNHVNAMLQLGDIFLWYGETEQSIRYTTLAIQILLSDLPVPEPTKVNATFNIEAAGMALSDLVHCLESVGVQSFLNGGTLLGAMREGTIIGHDKDIDIAVLPGVAGAPIEAAIRAHPDMDVDWVNYWGGELILIRVIHKNGIGSDIFFYREDDEYFYCSAPWGRYCVTWRDSKFGLSYKNFLGKEYLIPDQPERYLEENYNQWRKPNPWHVSSLTSYNLVGGFGPLQHANALLYIAKSLQDGDRDRACYYCEWVQQHAQDDIPFVDEILLKITGATY